MGIDPITLAAYAAIGASGAAVVSTAQAGKSAREQARAEQRKADIQNVRSVRQSIREARLAQASLVSQGAVSGALMGSGVAGGIYKEKTGKSPFSVFTS